MRITSIAKKELFHILRDPFTLGFAVGLPVLFVVIFGIIIDFNIKDIKISVYDGDKTESSRKLINTFTSSGFFNVTNSDSARQAISDLDSEKTKAALIINKSLEKDINSGKPTSVQLLLDGADNSSSGIILSYLSGIQLAAVNKLYPDVVQVNLGDTSGALASTVPAAVLAPSAMQTRFLFNPELNSRWFIIPGLAVIVLSIIAILLTALTIAREWEYGSMELLLSTPVKPYEIIAGKIIPYTVLGFLALILIYLTARLGFNVPFRGNHITFLFGYFLFLSSYLAWGILISIVTRRQQLAMMVSIVTGLLPSLLLSGFVFPIESMPVFFHYFTMLFPARWFMTISRGVMLKGAGVYELAIPFAALIVLNAILVSLAIKKFKKDLEP